MQAHEDQAARAAKAGTAGPAAPPRSADFLPRAARDAEASAPAPLPWRTMSRAECMQLAIALERALAARRVGSNK